MEIIVSGEKRYRGKQEIISKVPNFSLRQIQAVIGNSIVIYMPEGEYQEKDYIELVKTGFAKKIAEKTKGKITDEDIKRMIEGMNVEDIANVKIEVISDPLEYGEKVLKDEKDTIKSIFGDTKSGEYQYIRLEDYDCTQKEVKTMPNFSIGELQASIVTTDNHNDEIENVLYVYAPEREYEEKDYEELVHNQKRQTIIESIQQTTGDKLEIEEIKRIADEIAYKIKKDIEVVVYTNPYEYGQALADDSIRIDSIHGNTTYYECGNGKEFSLNALQVNKVQEVCWEDDSAKIVNERYGIYLPDEEYKKCLPQFTYQ